jgi:hypothetical protein
MTSLRQIEANRRNATNSTGPTTAEGKQRSRCNAVRHGLTAETVIGALEDAEDYKAFEEAIAADYDAQSAVERELVLRLASLLWRLRRATTMETGLFDIQAGQLNESRRLRQLQPPAPDVLYAILGRGHPERAEAERQDRLSLEASAVINGKDSNRPQQGAELEVNSRPELARCFLRLANLPSFVLDRLSRYEVMLWRQVDQILFALDGLDRCKPQEKHRRLLGKRLQAIKGDDL